MIRKRDWLWLFLFPLYLILGTFRHELAHAIVAAAQGAKILKFVFWPSIYPTGKFYFGYVVWQGKTNWLVSAAPYFIDLLTYSITFPLANWVRFRQHGVWLNLVIIGLLSPFFNTLFNYLQGGDIRDLLAVLPPPAVHLWFLLGLGLALFGLMWVFTRSAQAKTRRKQELSPS